MRLLLDTDAFCKLALCGVLDEAVSLLGVGLAECGRLPALPHMLRRGRLRRVYGGDTCDTLLEIASSIASISQPDDVWLDKLTPVTAIDPGEAQLFAAAAQGGQIVLTGDKRALRGLKDIEGFAPALSGRVVVLEAAMLGLCQDLGSDELRELVRPLLPLDNVARVCFSSGNPTPAEGLGSYFDDLVSELVPLTLWDPREREPE